jgi:hypothetical protein
MAQEDSWLLSRKIRDLFRRVDGGEIPVEGPLKNILGAWAAEAHAMEEGNFLPQTEEKIAALESEKAVLSQQYRELESKAQALQSENAALQADNEQFEDVLKGYSEKIAVLQKEGQNPQRRKPEEWPEDAIRVVSELAKLDEIPDEKLPVVRKEQLFDLFCATGLTSSFINHHLHKMHMEGLVFMVRDETNKAIRWEITDLGREVLVLLADRRRESVPKGAEEPALEKANIEITRLRGATETESVELPDIALQILAHLTACTWPAQESEIAAWVNAREEFVQHFMREMQKYDLVSSIHYPHGGFQGWAITLKGTAYLSVKFPS